MISPDTGGEGPVVDVADTHECRHRGEGGGEYVAGDCTRVHRVRGVEVDQGGVTGGRRGAATYRHQMKEKSSERVNVLGHVNVTPGLIIITEAHHQLIYVLSNSQVCYC